MSKRVEAPVIMGEGNHVVENGMSTLNSHQGEEVSADAVMDVEIEERESKPTRRTSDRSSTRKRRRPDVHGVPNAALFVGYVQEEETVEMIMKKFEKLEEIKKTVSEDTSAPSADGQMDENVLQKVFRETSTFTVEQAMRDPQAYTEDETPAFDEDGWEMSGVTTHENEDGETLFLFGDGTDDDLWDEILGKGKRKKTSSSKSVRGPRNNESSGVTQIAFISDMHGRYVTGLKKIRKVDPNAIVYQRIPPEIPSSWAKRIEPYRPKNVCHKVTTWRPNSVVLEENTFSFSASVPEFAIHRNVKDMLAVDLHELVKLRQNPFEGIVMSPPWKHFRGAPSNTEETPQQITVDGIEPEDLLKLKGLASRSVLPSGFIYIWSPKHLIQRVLRAMEKLDFHYVENAICVNLHIRNDVIEEPCRYFSQSKDTLLICRRGTKTKTGKIVWDRVEIRHQRTSDVHFEFSKHDPLNGHRRYPHSYVHNMAETMLPHGRYNPLPSETKNEVSETKPKLLHLWADPCSMRTGWLTVSQTSDA